MAKQSLRDIGHQAVLNQQRTHLLVKLVHHQEQNHIPLPQHANNLLEYPKKEIDGCGECQDLIERLRLNKEAGGV